MKLLGFRLQAGNREVVSSHYFFGDRSHGLRAISPKLIYLPK